MRKIFLTNVKKLDIISKQIYILMFIYPFIYLGSELFKVNAIYAVKDIIIYIIFSQILILFIADRIKFKKNTLLILVIMMYILISSLINYSDRLFWILGIREMIINPLMFFCLGYYFTSKTGNKIYNALYDSLLISVILTVIYAVIDYKNSFSSTGRLISFWNGEHESAIIAGLLIIWLLVDKKWNNKNKLLFFLSVIVIILSGSRSVVLALIISISGIVIFQIKGVKKIASIIFFIFFINLLYFNYEKIFSRPIDFNLFLRTSQWLLAFVSLKESPIIGIGIDKYGVVGNYRKVYSINGFSTSTMDSSLIKYTVNLGIIFLILFISLIFRAIKNFEKVKDIGSEKTKKMSSFLKILLIYSLMIGSVTGKLGAFPLNMYFYTTVGASYGTLLYFNRKSILD